MVVTLVVLPQRQVQARGRQAPRFEVELPPGASVEVLFRGAPLGLSVPADEAYSIGTVVLEAAGLAPLVLERDGSLIELWTADLGGDGRADLLFVFQNAGSGARKTLGFLDGAADGFVYTELPSLGSGFDGYLGHGTVSVRLPARAEPRSTAAVLALEYPVYGERLYLKAHPVDAVLAGSLPVEQLSDANANPKGGLARALFDWATWTWRPD